MGLSTTLELTIRGTRHTLDIKSSAIGCFYDVESYHGVFKGRIAGRTVEESQQRAFDAKYTLIPYCLANLSWEKPNEQWWGSQSKHRHLIVYKKKVWIVDFDSYAHLTGMVAKDFGVSAIQELERAIIERNA